MDKVDWNLASPVPGSVPAASQPPVVSPLSPPYITSIAFSQEKPPPLLAMTARFLPSDPLAALGSSVFFNVCEHLPYLALARLPSVCKAWRDFSASNQSGIWRSASFRIGLNPARISELKKLERDAQNNAPAISSQTCHGTAVDWREVCAEHVSPDVSWRNGKIKNFFVEEDHPAQNLYSSTAEQYTVDDEDQTCVIYGESGGIRVIDIETRQPLFLMLHVCPGYETMFCRGFLAIRGHSGDFRFRIFRTRNAIARSSNPWAAKGKICYEAETSTYLPDPTWLPKSVSRPKSPKNPKRPRPIGRGCLAYYRDVIMPFYGGVRSMRVLGEGSEREQVLLGIAGEGEVYLWDLDSASAAPETYSSPESDEVPSHLDFNEEFIFLPDPPQLTILSRATGQCVLSLSACVPPERFPGVWMNDIAALPGDRSDMERRADVLGGGKLSRPLELQGYPVGVPESKKVLGELGALWKPKQWKWNLGGPDGIFTCYPAGADLVYAHRSGQLLITRNYAGVLAVPDVDERKRRWGEQTFLLHLAKRIKSIAVHGTRVAVDTNKGLLFFDTGNLPLPQTSDSASSRALDTSIGLPSIRMHKVLRVDPLVDELTHNPQICSTAMYTRYLAHNAGQIGYRIRGLEFGRTVKAAGEV